MIARRPRPSPSRKQCYAAVMIRTVFGVAALLLATSAAANTLVTDINGIQIGPDGKLDHFKAFMIGNDGKVIQVLEGEDDAIVPHDRMIDGHGQTVLPGLIDAHGHVMDLGFTALRIDVTGTQSIAELQQR